VGHPKPVLPLVAAFFISLVLLTVPTAPPDLGEPSWSAVLRWAHDQGLQFGKDIVFTYGPLGFLLAPYTLSQPTQTLLLAQAALCFQSALGLCLLASRLGLAWRLLLLGIFVLESVTIELRADLIIVVGLLGWGLLCVIESGRRQRLCALSLVLFAGVVSLTKMTHLLCASFTVCAVATYALLDEKRWLGGMLPIGFASVFLLGWVACRQALSHLGLYLLNGFLFTRDYDQAVGVDGLPMLRLGGVLLAFLAMATVLLRTFRAFDQLGRHARWRRACLLAWVSGLFFMVWKHSMVRVERFHFPELLVFAPVVALGLEAVPGSVSKVRWLARWLALACCVVSWSVMEYAFLPDFPSCLIGPFRQFACHSRWLIAPADCRGQLEQAVEEWQRKADLPKLRQFIGQASVDVFGSHQAYALLNGLNYRPRPVFQSYAAYTAPLTRLNEDFYLSPRAPDYVLMAFSPVEYKFPSLEDGRVLRALLTNYEPVASEAFFLLLKRHSTTAAKLTLLTAGTVELGSQIDLTQYPAADLWLEVELEPRLLGRFVKFMTRSPVIRLSAWRQTPDGLARITRGRAVPSLLSAGFVASPCLLNLDDVRDLYTGERVVRPSFYCLEPGFGDDRLWSRTIRYRLYKIAPSLGLSRNLSLSRNNEELFPKNVPGKWQE
jgi:hypothetical protein